MAATLDGFETSSQASVCFLALVSRKRTPAPPPFSAINTMPAASSAERSFSTDEILASRPASNRFTVLSPTFAARARSVVRQSSAARAGQTRGSL